MLIWVGKGRKLLSRKTFCEHFLETVLPSNKWGGRLFLTGAAFRVSGAKRADRAGCASILQSSLLLFSSCNLFLRAERKLQTANKTADSLTFLASKATLKLLKRHAGKATGLLIWLEKVNEFSLPVYSNFSANVFTLACFLDGKELGVQTEGHNHRIQNLRVCTSSPLVLSSPFACLTQSRIKIEGKCSCGFYIYANFSVQRWTTATHWDTLEDKQKRLWYLF